jgi:hypothetical protein
MFTVAIAPATWSMGRKAEASQAASRRPSRKVSTLWWSAVACSLSSLDATMTFSALSFPRGLAGSPLRRRVSLPGRGRLLGGGRTRRSGSACGRLAAARPADPAAALRGHVGVGNAASGAALVAAAGLLVDRGPRPPWLSAWSTPPSLVRSGVTDLSL